MIVQILIQLFFNKYFATLCVDSSVFVITSNFKLLSNYFTQAKLFFTFFTTNHNLKYFKMS